MLVRIRLFLLILGLCSVLGPCQFGRSERLVRELPQFFVPGRVITVVIRWDVFGPGPPGLVVEVLPPRWTPLDLGPDAHFEPASRTIRFWTSCEGACLPEWYGVGYTVLAPPDYVDPATFEGSAAISTIYPQEGRPLYRDPWATIQQTVDSSDWGDCVMISAKETPFVENVVLKPGVNLVGFVDSPLYEPPSYDPPVIEAASADEPAITAAPYCKISGFVIRSSGVGIRVLDQTVEISHCVIMGTSTAAIEYVGATEGKITNCTNVDNEGVGILCHESSPNVVVSNSIFVGNGGKDIENCTARFCLLEDEIEPGSGENNIFGDPMFVNPAEGDYRLLRPSPCIDAGDNSGIAADALDILSKLRILFGGKSQSVDIGAYEYWFISLSRAPDGQELQLRWSSAPEKTYTVFYSTDFLNWQIADDNIPSAGAMTIWLDPIGWPPTVPVRFYRVAEKE